MSNLTRNDLVLLHTLCGARIAQLDEVCTSGIFDEPAHTSNLNYRADLRALQAKIDRAIDESEV